MSDTHRVTAIPWLGGLRDPANRGIRVVAVAEAFDPMRTLGRILAEHGPLHEDDIVRSVPGLLAAASVPATVVNWGGDAAVSIEEWCGYLSELTGLPVEFASTDQTIDSVDVDLTRLHELVGPSTVDWRRGLRRMVAARHPQLLR